MDEVRTKNSVIGANPSKRNADTPMPLRTTTPAWATENWTLRSAKEKKYKAGSVSATIWKNTGNRNGKETEFYTVSLTRSYKKGDSWQNTNSMRLQDIPDAILVLDKAYEYLRLKSDDQQGIEVEEENVR